APRSPRARAAQTSSALNVPLNLSLATRTRTRSPPLNLGFSRRRKLPGDGGTRSPRPGVCGRSVAGRVAGGEGGGVLVADVGAPARAAAAASRGVPAQPGDHCVGVAGVGVDGDPVAGE